jgi:4a-hydroxytetrahydrobiopterin dehydratase
MERILSRPEASAAVSDHGWRLLLGTLRTSVRVPSLARAVEVAARAVAACDGDADGHLHVDPRPERVELVLRTLARGAVTTRDVELAQRISADLRELGLVTGPDTGPDPPRSVQVIEIAIDALDIAAVRPFWRAVLGYADDTGPQVIDPVGLGPAVWFQQLDRPRPQRNRVHFDVCVPHDEARRRVEAALAAGGRLVSADRAPAFWVLSDVEGNEACVTTWQGRDG